MRRTGSRFGLARTVVGLLVAAFALGCGDGAEPSGGEGADRDGSVLGADASGLPPGPRLGAHVEPSGDVVFRLASTRATRVELWLYAEPLGATERLRVPLTPEEGVPVFAARVRRDELEAAGLGGQVYYGYRAWGPNWPYDAAWTPGSAIGFVADVDADGNRINPNKLLLDPYARELWHDPTNPAQLDGRAYRTRRRLPRARQRPRRAQGHRAAPRDAPSSARVPTRPLARRRHLRGPRARPHRRTSRRGRRAAAPTPAAGAQAAYLAALGVTAVEFLPDAGDAERRQRRRPAGRRGRQLLGLLDARLLRARPPLRVRRVARRPDARVRARWCGRSTTQGIKVFIDVVYNHTAEGGGGSLAVAARPRQRRATTSSTATARGFDDNTGVGANFNADEPARAGPHRRLAALLARRRSASTASASTSRRCSATRCARGCFRYDAATPACARRIAAELPARAWHGGAGVDLIAEPWGVGGGTYQVGNFPAGWAEWNGKYRDTLRRDQNQLGVDVGDAGRARERASPARPTCSATTAAPPAASVNFIVAHDGFTLRDLYALQRQEQRAGRGRTARRTAARTTTSPGTRAATRRRSARPRAPGSRSLLLSAGVPMITGGDELLRTQRCNNNPYNLDSPANWLDWTARADSGAFHTFTQRLLAFRRRTPRCGRRHWSRRRTWHGAMPPTLGGAYMDDPNQHVLAWRLDGARLGDPARALYVAYNRSAAQVRVTLPAPDARDLLVPRRRHRRLDGAPGNFAEPGRGLRHEGALYDLEARSLALFVMGTASP